MRCVICRTATTRDEPREHILAEGLGNTEHILRRGVVCGKCNNYFASKVEKPFLELLPIVAWRSNQAIPSKKGVVPMNRGVLMPGGALIETAGDAATGDIQISFSEEAINAVASMEICQIILPIPALVDPSRIVSRFVGKVGLEALANRFEQNDQWLDEMTDNPQLDELRRHVRYGQNVEWPVSVRRIYDIEAAWTEGSTQSYQIIHEFDFLCLESNEIYFVLALFGQELVINMGGPTLDGWFDWLRRNDNLSPLHCGKNGNLETMLQA